MSFLRVLFDVQNSYSQMQEGVCKDADSEVLSCLSRI